MAHPRFHPVERTSVAGEFGTGACSGFTVGGTSDFCLITSKSTTPLCNRNCATNLFCNNGDNSPPTTVWPRYALPLSQVRILRPRNSRGKIVNCPGQVPLSCPQTRSVRIQSVAMSSPRPHHVHSHSASSPSPRGVRVLEQSEAVTALASAVCPWTLSHLRSRHQPTVSRDLD